MTTRPSPRRQGALRRGWSHAAGASARRATRRRRRRTARRCGGRAGSGAGNRAGSPRRTSTIAPGPPVEAPMATRANRCAGRRWRRCTAPPPSGARARGLARRARRCVMTRMRETSFSVAEEAALPDAVGLVAASASPARRRRRPRAPRRS